MNVLSKEASQLLTWFAVFFLLGLALANPLMIYASIIPIFLYCLGAFIPSPKVEAKKIGLEGSAWVGETREVQVTGRISGGLGMVTLHDKLPEHFALTEGSNYRIIRKGFGDKMFSFSYKIKCTKRGTYYFKGIDWESRQILGLRVPRRGSCGRPSMLTVCPRVVTFRRIRVLRNVGYAMYPTESVAKVGTSGTDFKDIRDYVPGDPFSFINWKASARVLTRGKHNPLVNEYEREGKQSVWIFLDAHPEMNIGTSVADAFEHAIEAAISVAYYFLNRGFRLGMYVYNDLGKTFYPDTGKEQFIRIFGELLRLKPLGIGLRMYWQEGLLKAIEKNRKYLITLSPRVVIITHVTSGRLKDIVAGLTKISSFRRETRRARTKTMVFNILPYNLIPKINETEESAAKLLEIRSRELSRHLCRLRATVLNWDPENENLGTKLMNYMRLR